MTIRLPRKAAPPVPQRNEGTYLALIFVLAIIGGLLALVALVLPQVTGLILVVGGFCGFVALHYFTWGRWLIRWSTNQRIEAEHASESPEE